MISSFTEQLCWGVEAVSADEAEDEFEPPVQSEDELQRIPGTWHFKAFYRPRFPRLWDWLSGPKMRLPERFPLPTASPGVGFASLLRENGDPLLRARSRVNYLIQLSLSGGDGVTFLVSDRTAKQAACVPIDSAERIPTTELPFKGVRFIFERNSQKNDAASLDLLEFATGSDGEVTNVPADLLPPVAGVGECFRAPSQIPAGGGRFVVSAAYRMAGSKYSWQFRNVVGEYLFAGMPNAATFAAIDEKAQGVWATRATPGLPPVGAVLPRDRHLLVNLLLKLSKDPGLTMRTRAQLQATGCPLIL